MAHDGSRILVVDDESVVVKSCERILRAEGYDVEGVLGGREAIQNMEQKSYDLVLTDLKMPVIDGITLIKWIRKSRPDTGIVVITGYPSQETIKDALDFGIIDYLPKPFTPAILLDVTRRALEWIRGKAYVEEKPKKEEFPPSMLKEIDRVALEYKDKPGRLMLMLQRVQGLAGYLPPQIQRRIARRSNIPEAELHSIISFHNIFSMKPRGEHIAKVCLGAACFAKGTSSILEEFKKLLNVEVGEATEDRKFSLETARCLGACGLAPVMAVDQDTYGSLSMKRAIEVLNQYAPVGAKAAPAQEVEIKEG
ncbi:MAG: NAD(P)H-dependent oxidoreductase subunit E [Nitrospirota bacterium]